MTVLPRAILFDLDDTIISAYSEPGRAWREVSAEFAEHLAPHSPETVGEAISAYGDAWWADPTRHKEWRQKLPEVRRLIAKGGLTQLGGGTLPIAEEVAHRFADRFTSYREEKMHLFEGALETLATLKAGGTLMCLITNGDAATQRGKIERFGLAPYFHHIQIEGEHGFGKPEEAAYHHALRALGVRADEAWIVGDNLEWEVAAPQRLGFYAIWHDHLGVGLPPDSDVKPDRIIRWLAELLEPSP